MALGASVYKLVFDTQGLQNVTASRRELALSKKIMEETAPAADKLAAAEANLDRLVSKGLINVEQRNQTLAKTRTELMGTTTAVEGMNAAHLNGIPVIGRYASTFASLGPIGVATAAGVAVMTAGAGAFSAATAIATRNISDQINEIDDLLATTEKLDVGVSEYLKLSNAAERAEISNDSLEKGMEKMLANVSKAADGSSTKLKRVFDLMDVDAVGLKGKGPTQQMLVLSKALESIPDKADKVRASMAIFGSADFVLFDNEAIKRADELFNALRGDRLDTSAFAAMDSAVNDMNMALDVTWKKVTMAVVPAMKDLAEGVTNALASVNQSDDFSAGIDHMGNALRGASFAARALIEDLPRLEKEWRDSSDIGSMMGASGFLQDFATLGRLLNQVDHIREVTSQKKNVNLMEGSLQELNAIEELTDKLREEVATREMSTAQAKIWRLEQMKARDAKLVSDSTLTVARDTAHEASVLESSKAVDKYGESLEALRNEVGMTTRELDIWKQMNDGIPLVIATANAMERESLAGKKKSQDAIKDTIKTLDDEEAKLKLSARAYFERDLAKKGITDSTEVAKFGDRFDANDKLSKDIAAAKKATDAIAELDKQLRQVGMSDAQKKADNFRDPGVDDDKVRTIEAKERELKAKQSAADTINKLEQQIRQAGMTADEKNLDELKVTGVSDEQLKIIETLQKELALRGNIKSTIEATSGVIKAGSREAADAFSKANQAAVRSSFQQAAAPTDSMKADQARANAVGKVRDQLNDNLNKPSLADKARSQLMDNLAGSTVTPLPKPPTITGVPDSPQAAAANQAKEQLKETQKTNTLLGQLVEKTVPLTIEEVTL